MHTMQGTARAVTAHERATANTRATLTSTEYADRARALAYASPLTVTQWSATTVAMIDLAYGQAAADRVREGWHAAAETSAAVSAYWIATLPTLGADA